MPLVHMASKSKADEILRWEADAHILTGGPGEGGGIPIFKTMHGLCLFEREANFRDDSDFYMTVWCPEECKATEVMFATTRGWSYPCLGSSVDAPPGVYEAHARWEHREARRHAAVEAIAKLNKIHVGSRVRVVKSRKGQAPKGFEGEVTRITEEVAHTSQYGTWTTHRTMVFIVSPDGAWRTNINNCELLEVSPDAVRDAFDYAEAC